MPYTTMAPNSTLLLPTLVIAQPEKGSDNIKPTGSENNTAPKPASVKPRFCCTVAMRDAQLEKHSPAINNKTPTAMRSVLRVWDGFILIVSAISISNGTKCKKYT